MEIERVSDDRLSREVWRFEVYSPRFGRRGEVNIICSFYGREQRKTTRHKFVSEPMNRHSTSDPRRYNSGIEAKDVPLPTDVIEEARAQLVVNVYGPDADRRNLI